MESDAAKLHRTQPLGYLIGFPFGRRTSFLHSSLFVLHSLVILSKPIAVSIEPMLRMMKMSIGMV